MTTILVPTDFSPSAKSALLYAIAIAKRVKAKVIILHVYHAPVSAGRTPHILNYPTVRENVRMATQQLKELEDTWKS
jgi:nucleotide-binding universal stress UspA family protein